MAQKRAVIIGGGVGGLATAAVLAKAGLEVTLFEKNEQLGGRSSVWRKDGFTFDMGPSWYLMPDIFDRFYALFDKQAISELNLVKLSPSYRVFWDDGEAPVDLYSDFERSAKVFDRIEPGSSKNLKLYLQRSEQMYEFARDRFLYRNYSGIGGIGTPRAIGRIAAQRPFGSMDSYVSRYFKSAKLKQIMEYPLVFLGGSPYNTPAIYNMMGHVDFNLGVFYPQGGFGKLTESLKDLGVDNKVKYHLNSEVDSIITASGRACGVRLGNGKTIEADVVVSDAGVYHTETKLLSPDDRSFSKSYWETRTLAPSALILYLGVKGRIDNLLHHNLYFASDWRKGFAALADPKRLPEEPSIYVCAPSRTDPDVAPEGHENLFVLVPISAGLKHSPEQLKSYSDKLLEILEQKLGLTDLRNRIVVKRLFTEHDFFSRYHTPGGSMLGYAHTLRQSAWFRPGSKSKKVDNLYYAGADVNPGVGVPTSLISSLLVYKSLAGDKSVGAPAKIEPIVLR